MSVVKINVLTVPQERRAVLEERFGARAGEVDTTPGFESFQLLRPTDANGRYFVVTQWESEDAFEAWMASRAFAQAHGDGAGQDAAQAHGDGAGQDAAQAHGDGAGQDAPHAHGGGTGDEAPGRPAASDAELLSFEVVQESRGQR